VIGNGHAGFGRAASENDPQGHLADVVPRPSRVGGLPPGAGAALPTPRRPPGRTIGRGAAPRRAAASPNYARSAVGAHPLSGPLPQPVSAVRVARPALQPLNPAPSGPRDDGRGQRDASPARQRDTTSRGLVSFTPRVGGPKPHPGPPHVRRRSEWRGRACPVAGHLVIPQALVDARGHLSEPTLAVLAHDHVHFTGAF
jgi:hypothetical protein